MHESRTPSAKINQNIAELSLLGPSAESGREIIDLRHYLRVISVYKWSIMTITLVVTLIGLLVIKQMQSVYEATTTLLIEVEQPDVTGIKDIYGPNSANRDYIQTQHEILKSRSLAEQVVKQLDLVNQPEFDAAEIRQDKWQANLPYEYLEVLWPFAKSLQETFLGSNEPMSEQGKHNFATSRLMAGLAISPIVNTQIVKVSFQSSSPVLGARISNAIANQFINGHLTARLQLTEKANSWLDESLGDLQVRMRASEETLQNFREQERLVDVKGVRTLNAQELGELTERFTDAQKERLRAQNVFEQIYILGPNPNYRRLIEIPAIANESMVSGLKKELASGEAKVSELSERYGPKHPKMIATKTALEATRVALQQQAQLVAKGLQTEYKIALENEAAIKAQQEKSKDGLQQVNRKEFKLRELEREVEINRQLYDTFMTRAKETNEMVGLQAAHARIIDNALPPKIPLKPKKKMLMGITLVFGLFLGAGTALARSALDNTTKTTKDIEAGIGLQVLGELPKVKSRKSNTAFEGFLSDSQGLFAECIRTLRTNLILADPGHTYKTIVVTSSAPNEGKSTVALNLAEAFGQNEKVLLIDGDMRRPMLAHSLGLSPHNPGLTDLIAGFTSVDECLNRIEGSNVDVLIAGLLPNNPLELLSSQRFGLSLQQLKKRYKRIVIDSSPISQVSDAMLLAASADAVLYVVRADSTPLPLLKYGIKRLAKISVPVAGAVLNQVKANNKFYRGAEKYSHYHYSARPAPTIEDIPILKY